MKVVAPNNSNKDNSLKDTFTSYAGPVLRLDNDVQLVALNDAAFEIADILNDIQGVPLVPAIVQMAVKTRSEGKALTRTFTLPITGRQIEFLMLPQSDGSQLMIGRDSTLETNIRTALAESRTRFKDLVDVAADFAWETDEDGLFSYISPRGALGYQPEELLGEAPESLLLAPETAPIPLPFQATWTLRNVELWVRTRAGEPACIQISAMPIHGKNEQPAGARGIAIDVTEERNRQSELARLKIRERLVTYIVDALRNEVSPTDMLQAAANALARSTSADSCVVQVREHNGPSLEFVVYGTGPDPDMVEHILAHIQSEQRLVTGHVDRHHYLGISTGYGGVKNGSILLWRSDASTEWDEDEQALLKAIEPQFGIVFRQITDQHELERLSRTDELTGLRNRRAFIEDLKREMQRYERYGTKGALLFVDLDNFKPINDQFGHEKGDEALTAVGHIMTASTRPYDLVCRLGGDEFAAWLEGADAEIAKSRAESFLSKLDSWRQEVLGDSNNFGMSIGIALFESGKNEDVDGLIARADSAMYDAKSQGKNGIIFAANSHQGSTNDGK
ncbi:MAG: diguanylate cyclase [Alphaproteobacteria bacterium]|nr:diguanylate cyclase [Alphaproteobacteria bacterium]